MTLQELNAVDADIAGHEFIRCCGSKRWADMMTAARPFTSVEAMDLTADVIWAWLTPADWREAFAAHPRIGGAGQAGSAGKAGLEREASAERSTAWSDQEQAGARGAASHVLDRLAALNREYEQRFGYIFIVCATGKSGDEMLALLQRRLHNAQDDELRIAAGEQAKIARLRLGKLVAHAPRDVLR